MRNVSRREVLLTKLSANVAMNPKLS